MKAKDFDRIFDEVGDISSHVDRSSVHRPAFEQKRVNVDSPVWVVQALDLQARRLGGTRQAIIKVWIADRLKLETESGRQRPRPQNGRIR
jgi:hypothetical protein